MPVMALLSVALVRLAGRRPVNWLGAFAAALIAVASHLLLDLTNVYGIRLLLPFSARWLRLDITGVVDLWIWAVLLLSIAGPFLARLVGSEIGSSQRKAAHHGRGFAWFALVFVLLYSFGRSVLHARALAVIDARVYQGAPPARSVAVPDEVNPWRWRAVVETGDFFAVEDLNLAADFDPTRAQIFHKPDPDPALDAARRTFTFERFLEFSQYPLWTVSPAPEPENAKLVQVVDMRFGTPATPGFYAGAVVDAKLRVLETYFHLGRPRSK
jgi:inner membrane protein